MPFNEIHVDPENIINEFLVAPPVEAAVAGGGGQVAVNAVGAMHQDAFGNIIAPQLGLMAKANKITTGVKVDPTLPTIEFNVGAKKLVPWTLPKVSNDVYNAIIQGHVIEEWSGYNKEVDFHNDKLWVTWNPLSFPTKITPASRLKHMRIRPDLEYCFVRTALIKMGITGTVCVVSYTRKSIKDLDDIQVQLGHRFVKWLENKKWFSVPKEATYV